MNNTIKALSVCAIAVFCIHVFSNNKADVDLWGNIGFVSSPAWSEDFKTTNTYSFTDADHPWINHEWLGEYILNRIFTFAGNPSLIIFKTALGILLIGILYASMRKSAVSGPVCFFLLLLIISTIGYGFSTRPHHFTYLLYAAFLFALKHLRGKAIIHLLAVPALFVLWTNLHGAFFIGIILYTVYCMAGLFRRPDTQNKNRPGLLFAVPPLLFLASLANPFGLSLWSFIFKSAGIYRPFLSEWGPFNPLTQWQTHPDFIVLAALALTVLPVSRKEKDPAWISIFALSLCSALFMRRNIPLFAITVPFAVPEYFEAVAGSFLQKLKNSLPRAVTAAALAAFTLMSCFFAATFNKSHPLQIEVPRDMFPVEMIRFMETRQIKGRMIVWFDWAEYCIWKLYPDCRVFLDGRFCSAYSTETMRDFFRFIYMQDDWQEILDKSGADIVLIHRDNPVYKGMRSLNNWHLVVQSRIAALFLLKNSPKQAGQIDTAGTAIAIKDATEPAFFP